VSNLGSKITYIFIFSYLANTNYRQLNTNFKKIEHFEHEILHHSQELETKLSGLNIAERQLEAKNIRLYLFMQISNQKSSYFSNLKALEIQTPADILLFQHLLTNKKYCKNLQCYKDAIFNFNKTVITLNAISTQIYLQQKLYISCNLNFKYNIVSIYHGSVGAVLDDTFTPDDLNLPPVQLSKLEAGLSTLTRKPDMQEFLQDVIWPVYSDSKVSFSCKIKTKLKINGKMESCNQAIHFISKPDTVQMLDGEDVWVHTDSHPKTFFLQALDWSFEPTKQTTSINLWSSDTTNPHIFEVISEHLKSMSPIESGLWSSLAVIIIVSLLSIPVCCFCLCLAVLKACMPGCCSNCLFKTVNDKIFSQRELTMALALLHAQNDPSARKC
jgi:hypothetical protein